MEEAQRFSDQIIVVTCDHFFDRVAENRNLLEGIYAAHSDVTFVEFPFDRDTSYGAVHWHNLARLIGAAFSKKDQLLFLDVDEVMEGETFLQWLVQTEYKKYEALRLACYWYFREPQFQATSWEEAPLFIKRSALTYDLLMHPAERAGSFASTPGNKARHVLSLENRPMCHHYSWVRSEEQMLRKVQSWGHRNECDWSALVEREFSQPFSGRDFVYGYTFKEETSFLREAAYRSKEIQHLNHVHRLTVPQSKKIELQVLLESHSFSCQNQR